MERSGNFYKAIRLGYILISILIGCMAYNSLYEWQEIEALELGNKKIDELRKEINNINIQMIKFSLLGETILEWNDKDIEHYHARRMAMDSMLCRFKATYPAERIDSVRSLLEDKERQMFQIVRLMDEQQSINKKIANQIPVIVQTKGKPKGRFFWFTFGICMVRIRYADQKLLCLQWKCGLGLEMALSVDARRGSAPCRWAFPGVLFIIKKMLERNFGNFEKK